MLFIRECIYKNITINAVFYTLNIIRINAPQLLKKYLLELH